MTTTPAHTHAMYLSQTQRVKVPPTSSAGCSQAVTCPMARAAPLSGNEYHRAE